MSNPGADQSNFFSEKGHIIFPILGTLGGLILLVGGYALWRGPHRQFFPCLNQRKREPLTEDEAARTRQGIQAWGGESALGPMSGPGPGGGLVPPRGAGRERGTKRSTFFARWSAKPTSRGSTPVSGLGKGESTGGRNEEVEMELGLGAGGSQGHGLGHGRDLGAYPYGASGAAQVQRAYRQTMSGEYSDYDAPPPGTGGFDVVSGGMAQRNDVAGGTGMRVGDGVMSHGAGGDMDEYRAYHAHQGMRPDQGRSRSRSDFSRSSAGSVSRGSTLGGSFEAHTLQPKIEEEPSFYADAAELGSGYGYGTVSPASPGTARALLPSPSPGSTPLSHERPSQTQLAAGYFALPSQTRPQPGAAEAEGDGTTAGMGLRSGSPFAASRGDMGQNPFGTPPGEMGQGLVHVPPSAPTHIIPLRLPHAPGALSAMQMHPRPHPHAAQRGSQHFIQPARGGRRDSVIVPPGGFSGRAPEAYRATAPGGGGSGGRGSAGPGQRGTRQADRAPVADASDADVQFL